MSTAITNKRQMYSLLASGALGNTIPQYFSVADWKQAAPYPYWGVRTMVPGGPCRLNCPIAEVEETASRPEFAAAGINISAMVDRIARVTLWADVYDSDTGLIVYGIECPPRDGSWRAKMPSQGREWRGLAAKLLLDRHLNPNSLADLDALRRTYAGHVYELSACDRLLGTVPGRNAILWECRKY